MFSAFVLYFIYTIISYNIKQKNNIRLSSPPLRNDLPGGKVKHGWDYRLNPVTCKASDVLIYGTGYCYSKSHLLAALLRANGIPSGLCYQRLILDINISNSRFCLHGLNSVYLKKYGWYRIDARGNKPGVDADFCPPAEKLAFPIPYACERNLDGILAEPLPSVIKALTQNKTIEDVYENLPDIEMDSRY